MGLDSDEVLATLNNDGSKKEKDFFFQMGLSDSETVSAVLEECQCSNDEPKLVKT